MGGLEGECPPRISFLWAVCRGKAAAHSPQKGILGAASPPPNLHRVTRVNNTAYVVPRANAFLPAAAWYLPFYLCIVFALCERKNYAQNEDKVRLRKITPGLLRNSC